ncbi:MAG: hypothetical protein L3J58_00290 [Emcibacter sp.]|nr:hypothetical protein [Emcibacter sp.]
MIQKWAARINRYNIPVYVHSLSPVPNGIRNLTEDTANHEAVRAAFNRALIIKGILKKYGIAKDQLVIKTSAQKNMLPENKRPNNQFKDIIIITIHRD